MYKKFIKKIGSSRNSDLKTENNCAPWIIIIIIIIIIVVVL